MIAPCSADEDALARPVPTSSLPSFLPSFFLPSFSGGSLRKTKLAVRAASERAFFLRVGVSVDGPRMASLSGGASEREGGAAERRHHCNFDVAVLSSESVQILLPKPPLAPSLPPSLIAPNRARSACRLPLSLIGMYRFVNFYLFP